MLEQDEKRREDKQLVGDRVEELTEVSHLTALAGKIAVDLVGGAEHEVQNEGGDCPGACGDTEVVAAGGKTAERELTRNHEQRDEQNANARDDVGGRPNARDLLALGVDGHAYYSSTTSPTSS